MARVPPGCFSTQKPTEPISLTRIEFHITSEFEHCANMIQVMIEMKKKRKDFSLISLPAK